MTTVVARVCLNMLRARNARREDSLGVHLPDPVVSPGGGLQPEEEALLADFVGLALLVVLDTLSPAERLAFVLHDLFQLPFEEIAPMVGRSPAAARQLASRARRRVKGAGPEEVARLPEVDRRRHGQLLALWLLIHENVYHQHQHGWINRETYVSWTRELEAFVAQKHLARWWGELCPFFEPAFAAHVSRLIAAPGERPPP